ncbi:ORF6C domain-containing protein [Enterococcus alishanensis]
MNQPQIIELYKQRLLTTGQLADFYSVREKQIQDNFLNNKDKFVEGKHYYRLEGEKLKEFKNCSENIGLVDKRTPQLILYTKQGASRHSKMLGTEKAWDMYDELEEHYFNPQYQPMSIEQMMIHQLQEMETVKSDVELLKTETILNASQRRKVNGKVRSIVINVLGGQKSNAYKDISVRNKCFSNCYKQLKDYFDVSSYMDIPKVRFDEAMDLIPKWQPTLEIQVSIDLANGSGHIFGQED